MENNQKNETKKVTKGRYTYLINEKKGVVVCIAKKTFNGDTYECRGISRCNIETDKFNEDFGMELAKLRAILKCNSELYKCEFSGSTAHILQRKIDYYTYLLNMKKYLDEQIPQIKKDIKELTDSIQ